MVVFCPFGAARPTAEIGWSFSKDPAPRIA
jgi:hypothetical protein